MMEWTLLKLIINIVIVAISYLILKVLSEKNFTLSLMKEKLPKRIRNAL